MSRVLVIADQPAERQALATEIARAPHTVKAIAAGDLRIEAARDWAPDIIVMQMSTDSAALPLRIGMMRDPELSSVPFIVIGGSEDEARALGAHAFVISPPPMEALLKLVSRFAAMRMPLPA